MRLSEQLTAERDGRAPSTLPVTYFSYTGWIIVTMLAVTHLVRLRLGERGWMFTWQLVAVGAVTSCYVASASLRTVSPARLRAIARFVRASCSRFDDGFAVAGWLPGDNVRKPRFNLTSSLGALSSSFAAVASRSNVRIRLAGWLPARVGRRGFDITVPLWSIVSRTPAWLAALGYVAAALTLLVLDHRRFLFAIAMLQTSAIFVLRPGDPRAVRILLAITSLVSWAAAGGLTFTHLSDWFANADSTTGLSVAAFTFAFALVLLELCRDAAHVGSRKVRFAVLGAAATCFVLFALRTDNLIADWVPLHRSYFTDPAQAVRAGHWLLWDVPSLYGFFSVLTLALLPTRDSWQALYALTAFFLAVQSCIAFAILRWNRAGYVNVLFAVGFPLAAFGDNVSRYAWSSRLYPQGGLRFFWIVNLLFVAFLMYVWRGRARRVAALRACGHALWLVSLLWSFECGVWATVVWVPYAVLDALTNPAPRLGVRPIAARLWRRCWPLVALPALTLAAIETVYHVAVGSGPDWRGYVEFTGLFASGEVRPVFHVQAFGAAWCIMLVLGACGALGIVAANARRWGLFRLLFVTWSAVWVTASYYAVEPLDLYVAFLLGVLVPASAIVIFASRESMDAGPTPLFARISIAPLAVLSIAFMLGEPSRIADIRMPLASGSSLDSTRAFPPVSGELGTLIAKAGIRPSDKVLFPIGPYWTELRQGLILPFYRSPDGSVAEYASWLPAGAVAQRLMYNALTPSRRRIYVDRFLARSNGLGWYITYREPADCAMFSQRLKNERTYASTNFSASLCAYIGKR